MSSTCIERVKCKAEGCELTTTHYTDICIACRKKLPRLTRPHAKGLRYDNVRGVPKKNRTRYH